MTTGINIKSVHVSYMPYLNAYGKAPRGLGSWAFRMGRKVRLYYGTFTEARAEAVKDASAAGLRYISVES